MKFESVNEVFKRFLRGFRFSNVVLLKRTTFENLWKTVRISVVPRSVNDRSILLDGVNYVTVGISIQ